MEVRSGGHLKFSLFFLFFSIFTMFICGQDRDLSLQLSWEKDFELILELQGLPTRGEIKKSTDRETLLKQREDLQEKKKVLEKRLDLLRTPIYTDQLYDEMLEEGTNDINSTKESIEKKLKDVNLKLDEVERKLRNLKNEH
jgi:chromosome segregation ATPase